jgi:putative SOS response-associated peptidase YedK
MCGRFVSHRARKAYARALGIPVEDLPENPDDWQPRYNVCPGTEVDVIRAAPRGVHFARPWWGLLPYWQKDPKAARPINARAETAAERPMFRDALRLRRCLVPADGYFEWKTTPRGKIPYFFRRRDGEPIFLAGIWERWTPRDGGPGSRSAIESFALFTTRPNAVAARIHDRMPAMVDAANAPRWLDPEIRDAGAVADLLGPCADDVLEAWPVSRAVSNPAAEGPALIEPVADDGTTGRQDLLE